MKFLSNKKFSFTKMHLKRSSAKWRPFCPGGSDLKTWPKIYACICELDVALLVRVRCWRSNIHSLFQRKVDKACAPLHINAPMFTISPELSLSSLIISKDTSKMKHPYRMKISKGWIQSCRLRCSAIIPEDSHQDRAIAAFHMVDGSPGTRYFQCREI